MGRGNLFLVCKKSLANFECYDENSFDLEDAASLHIQWVEATDTETSKAELKNLYDLLKSSGFKVTRANAKASLDAFAASEDGNVYSKSEFKSIFVPLCCLPVSSGTVMRPKRHTFRCG